MDLGEALGERYRLEGELGASGDTFLAHDSSLRRKVVIKLVAVPEGDDWRSRTEVRRAARLSHPGVAAILDVLDEEYEGRLIVIREFVEGPTLAEKLADGATLPAQEVRRIGGAVATALAACHESHLLHGDLRPEKIVIAPDGEARLLDVGLHPAGWVDELSEVRLTTGSPAYCSPEVAQGAAAAPAADCWALGVCLFEALEGCAPIRRFGSLSATMQAIAVHTPASCSDTSELGAVVDDLLAVEPEERCTAGQAAERLAHAFVVADVTEPLPRRAERDRRRGGALLWWGAGAAALLLLGGGAVLATLPGGDPASEGSYRAEARMDGFPGPLGQTDGPVPSGMDSPTATWTTALPTRSTVSTTSTSTSTSTTTPVPTVTVTETPTPPPPPPPPAPSPTPTPTPPAPKPTAPQNTPYVKSWQGSINGDHRPYTATVNVRQAPDSTRLVASVTYTFTDREGGSCTGSWSESGRSGSTVKFTERIASGPCVNGVTVTLTKSVLGQRYGVEYPGAWVWGYLS